MMPVLAFARVLVARCARAPQSVVLRYGGQHRFLSFLYQGAQDQLRILMPKTVLDLVLKRTYQTCVLSQAGTV